jgi:tetratricopeptide (TPR) repeat protein
MMSDNNDILNDMLAHTDKDKLNQFIREYASDNEDFLAVFMERFSPKPKSSATRKQPEEDYVKIIQKAFAGTENRRKSRYGYRNDFEDFGFDAEVVRVKLEPLLEKARFYSRHDNKEEAIRIAQKLIDTIPDYWDENFDYEGDVQVVYDEAIDLLEEMLKEKLSDEQKELIFSWYEKVIGDKKHAYVGLNTSLEALELYFASDAVGGFDRVLRIIDQRIAGSDEYDTERAVLDKIYLLVEHDRKEDAEQTIEQYLYNPGVRSIKLSRLMEAGLYDDAIRLLEEGIGIARKKQAIGTVNMWRKELLSVYTQLNNHEKMVEITKALFVEGSEQRACYQSLKKMTPKEAWPDMLVWILHQLTDRGFYNTNELKADIFVEHAMWDELWQLCRKGSIGLVRKYEKYLCPRYEKEVFTFYHQYVQQQATITDKEAYKRVADTLNRMILFDGGSPVVRLLVNQYRQTYKRRIYMMKELDRVNV